MIWESLKALLPEVLRFLYLLLEECCNCHFIDDILLLPSKGSRELVVFLIEESGMLSQQQGADGRKLALSLGDRVKLDAFHEHLYERRRLGILGPGQWQGVQRD